jgi:hypothetical protein
MSVLKSLSHFYKFYLNVNEPQFRFNAARLGPLMASFRAADMTAKCTTLPAQRAAQLSALSG